MRVLHKEIEKCADCPYYQWDEDGGGRGDMYCVQLETIIVDPDEIDEDCPLPLKEDLDI